MAIARSRAAPGAQTNSDVPLKLFVLPGLLYPWWHLLAPRSAADPWLAWWLISGAFLLVALFTRWSPFVNTHRWDLLMVCAWLITLQLYLLAFVNAMHPFYAVGSTMAVLTIALVQRSKLALLAYVGFVLPLGGTLFVLAPDASKAAYWGGMLPVLAFAYYRLAVQTNSAELRREQQELLEGTVEQRTRELSEMNAHLLHEMEEKARLEEELRFSHKMDAVGRLAGAVAHDFNNLLSTIGVYAGLLLEAIPSDSALRRDIEQIEKTNHQAAALTQQLLTFARRSEAETGVLDLNEIVEGASSMLRHLLAEDAKLVIRLGEGSPCVRANRDQLEQVLINLALNGRDAMPVGGTLTVETSVLRRDELESPELRRQLLPHDEYALLAVTDTGVGMDAETRARAFDPFFTSKQVDKGTGLGLSIVYGIVRQGGGSVRVLSEAGRGARFELYWPRAEEGPSERATPARGPGPRSEAQERILLVEDQGDLRRALRRILANVGYDVVDAENAENALELATAPGEEPDLVISDVVMPRVSGFELAERLKAKRSGAKVLLISGHMNHPSLRDRPLPPDLPLLAKPFTPQDLREKVRQILDTHAGPLS